MIYARLTIVSDGFAQDVKLVAQNITAYEDYKKYAIDELGCEITNEFTDDDFGSIVILPEDFKY